MKIAIASAKSSSDLMTATNQGHGYVRRILIESNAFTDDGNALTSADASGCQTVPTVAAAQLKQHGQH